MRGSILDLLRLRLLFFSLASLGWAHDIPVDVTAQLWLRPEADRMRILFRVPLQAVRDVQFPATPEGYLDLEKLAPLLPGAAKVTLLDAVDVLEDGRPLNGARVVATQISLISDRSFETFAGALARVEAPRLATSERLLWNQVLLDVLAEAPIRSSRSPFAVRTRLDHLATRVATSLRFELPGVASRAYHWTADPGLVPLDPSWTEAVRGFVSLGVKHILGGADHLLFLLCLVIPLRRLGELAVVVTAFTLAHSLTLIAAAYGWGPQALWFPPLIETLIAASILYMAIENTWRAPESRWLAAFVFGLVHGFGFSFALREQLQFAGSHLLLSLLGFNGGVEIGQLAVLLLAVPILRWLRSRVPNERTAMLALSLLVAHTSWHWMLERGEALGQFSWNSPDLDAAFLASVLRWLIAVLLAGAVLWWLRRKPRAIS